MSTPHPPDPDPSGMSDEERRLLDEKHARREDDEAARLLAEKQAPKLDPYGQIITDPPPRPEPDPDPEPPQPDPDPEPPRPNPVPVPPSPNSGSRWSGGRLWPVMGAGALVVAVLIGFLLLRPGDSQGSAIATATPRSSAQPAATPEPGASPATPAETAVAQGPTSTPAGPEPGAVVADSYSAGRALFDEGKFGEAAESFERAYALNPVFPDLAGWLSRAHYEAARQAYSAAEGSPADTAAWDVVAQGFARAVEVGQDNFDAREALSGTYYNRAANIITGRAAERGADAAQAARELLDKAKAVELVPEDSEHHQTMTARRLVVDTTIEQLNNYERGVREANSQNWKESVAAFEEAGASFAGVQDFPGDDGPFLDVAQRLYEAYVAYAAALIAGGAFADADALLTKAADLDVEDQSQITELVALLPTPTPPPTATPRPRPTATPRPPSARAFRAIPVRDFQGSGNNGTFSSCIGGKVTYGGQPINGALLEVNNGPNNRFQARTDGAGNYQVCGLGASTWSVVLYYIPGSPPIAGQAVAAVYVNGNRAQTALVNFAGP